MVNRLMFGLVEIGDFDGLADLTDGVLAHQHAAKHGHLRIIVMRGNTVEQIGYRTCAAALSCADAGSTATIPTVAILILLLSFCHSQPV